MEHELVEPCARCARHVHESEARCPFCGAPHTPGPRVAPPRAPTRAMLAAWAGIFVASCGGGQAIEGDDANASSSGDESNASQENGVPHGESGGGELPSGEEASCAGRCGSHHHPPCMDDPVDPCPAPPYGAPPLDDSLV